MSRPSARYVEAGSIAVKWIEQGEYILFARIDASNEFWQIQAQLKRERG